MRSARCVPHDEVAPVGLVDEELGLGYLRDPELHRLVSDRGHQDPAADGERSDQLDPLDVAVPAGPAVDVCPQAPDPLRRRARLDALLVRPHRSLLVCSQVGRQHDLAGGLHAPLFD
jgi:hypothetical protein